MENSLVKNMSGQVSFVIRQRDLTKNQKSVLELINNCVSKAVILDEYILQNWLMEKIIKPRQKIIDGRYLGYKDINGHNAYEKIQEYDYYKRRILERGGLLEGYYLYEAKQILKSCIGQLVVRGYLTVIPNIKISDIPEIENK